MNFSSLTTSYCLPEKKRKTFSWARIGRFHSLWLFVYIHFKSEKNSIHQVSISIYVIYPFTGVLEFQSWWNTKGFNIPIISYWYCWCKENIRRDRKWFVQVYVGNLSLSWFLVSIPDYLACRSRADNKICRNMSPDFRDLNWRDLGNW